MTVIMRVENGLRESLFITEPLLADKTDNPYADALELEPALTWNSEEPPEIALYLRREEGRLVLTLAPWQQPQ